MDILIVDDSLVFRHAIAAALNRDPTVRVVGSVRNGRKALEFLQQRHVDLVTLDMEMPEMDGLATLAEIQKLNAGKPRSERIGVVVVSTHTHAGAAMTLRALEAGAFDFVAKPAGVSEEDGVDLLHQALAPRVLSFASARARAGLASPAAPVGASSRLPSGFFASGTADDVDVICIGVSTGGPRALAEMLPALCKVTNLPIFLVQHMPEGFTASLAESLSRTCQAHVREAVDGESVQLATVYVAPGGRHLLIGRGADGLVVRIADTPPENRCRPSVDVLFRSAASVCQGRVIAIVMTGMGNDGEKSLRMLRREGARIIAQDEATSVVWGMPGSAVATGCVDKVAALMDIPSVVGRMLGRG
jgi:two-component system chemotaxis response regulator CheB